MPTDTSEKSSHQHESTGRSQSAAQRIVTNAFGNVFPPLAALATAPIMAQGLGVDGRGAVAAATAPYLLAVVLATLGVPEALTYFIAQGQVRGRRLIVRSCAAVCLGGFVVTTTIWVLAPKLADNSADTAHFIQICSLSIVPSLVVACLRGIAAGRHRWTLVTAERSLTGLARLAPMLVLWLSGHLTVLNTSLSIAISPVVGGLVYIGLASPRDTEITSEVKQAELGQLLAYGSHVWVGAAAGILLLRVDQLLMTPLASARELGIYAVAVNVSEVPLIVNTAIREVMFSEHAGKNDLSKLTQAARTSGFLCSAFGLGLAVVSPLAIPLLFGSDFASAIPVALLLLLAVAIGTPGSIAGAGLSAQGRPGLRSVSLAVACLVNLALIILLVPGYGAMGAAVATAAGNAISSNLNILFLRRMTKTRWTDFYAVRRADLRYLATTTMQLAGRGGGR